MNNATLDRPSTRLEEKSHSYKAVACDEANGINHSFDEVDNVHTADVGIPRQSSPRWQRILNLKIEFVACEAFDDPALEKDILAPPPKRETTAHPRFLKASLSRAPEGTPPYLASLYETPLLTPEQEVHLFRKMNYLNYRASIWRDAYDPGKSPETYLDQIERNLDGAYEIRNRIVQANLRLVVSIARRFVDSSNTFEDLVSDGNVPLIRAVEIFDFSRGFRFSTYATWAIRNTYVRVAPRSRLRSSRYLTGTQDLFEGTSETRTSHGEHEHKHRRVRAMVASMLERLDCREQKILMSRFGLDSSGDQKKFREISCQWDISTERVRQIVAKSLSKLRGIAQDADEDGVEYL